MTKWVLVKFIACQLKSSVLVLSKMMHVKLTFYTASGNKTLLSTVSQDLFSLFSLLVSTPDLILVPSLDVPSSSQVEVDHV